MDVFAVNQLVIATQHPVFTNAAFHAETDIQGLFFLIKE